MNQTKKYAVRSDSFNEWKSDVEGLELGEECLIISGEGFYPLMEVLYPHFRRAAEERKVVFKAIIGPVVSVDAEGNNPLFSLAKENLFTLYKSGSRERLHFRTMGHRKVFSESYHLPIDALDSRFGIRYEDPFVVNRHRNAFYNKIDAFGLKEYRGEFDKDEFVCLTLDEIERLKYPFGEYFDALTEKDVRELIKCGDINKNTILNTLNLSYISAN